jgi:DUF438 domain-containing protein
MTEVVPPTDYVNNFMCQNLSSLKKKFVNRHFFFDNFLLAAEGETFPVCRNHSRMKEVKNMSELINHSTQRKQMLKHLILQLHQGEAPVQVQKQLATLLQKIPYDEVVQVEQELIQEGLPAEDVLKLCDVHTQGLEGRIDVSGAKQIPPGHPADTLLQENAALLWVIDRINDLYGQVNTLQSPQEFGEYILQLKTHFHSLMDVDKHYRKKENLLFPYLEKHGITGPPKVMWGKHDEARTLLKAAIDALYLTEDMTLEKLRTLIEITLRPALTEIADMTMKEENILLPMSMDTLSDVEWYEIYQQIPEIGFCLYDPKVAWKPAGVEPQAVPPLDQNLIRLPSGKLTPPELIAILNTLPVDMTFVDKDDKVKYFSQGQERIFDRNRSILQRDVRLCHPPSSVHVVEQILSDFKSGKASRAPFWIQMGGRFIHIEYFAIRDEGGNYLGTLEVSQDLAKKRQLTDEQRLLSYAGDSEK